MVNGTSLVVVGEILFILVKDFAIVGSYIPLKFPKIKISALWLAKRKIGLHSFYEELVPIIISSS